MNRFSINY